MHLTEDNCQVAYFCGIRGLGSDKGILSLAVKLQGRADVASITFPDYTEENEGLHKKKLQSYLTWKVPELLMSQPKPILLVVNSPSFPFLLLKQILEKCYMWHCFYGIIVGFANALPVLMENIPSRTRAEQFELPVLVREVLRQEYTGERYDMKYSVNALEKVVTSLTTKSQLIANCGSYVEVILSGLDAQKLAFSRDAFNAMINNKTINTLKKLASSRIPFDTLKKVFRREGSRGIEDLFNEKHSRGEVLIDRHIQIAMQELRWIDFRKQLYHEENPFIKRQDIHVREEFSIDQFLIDQAAVVQVPANRAPINELPIHWDPIERNQIPRGSADRH